MLIEKLVHTDKYAGRADIINGIEDFETYCEYSEEWHTYTLNGVILPSVTRMLDDGSFNNIDEDILIAAQKRGTVIHSECQDWLESGEIGFTDELQGFIDIYEHNKELFSQANIMDIKSGGLYTKKVYGQLRMYANAIYYLTQQEINDFYVIHLPKNKNYRLVKIWKDGQKIRSKTIYKVV